MKNERDYTIEVELTDMQFHQETMLYGGYAKGSGKKVRIDSRDLGRSICGLPKVNYNKWMYGK